MKNEKMQLILEIMRLGIEITNTTDADIFVNYSGHTNQLDVDIHSSGWETKHGPDIDGSFTVYIDKNQYRTEKDILKNLAYVRDRLISMQEVTEDV